MVICPIGINHWLVFPRPGIVLPVAPRAVLLQGTGQGLGKLQGLGTSVPAPLHGPP